MTRDRGSDSLTHPRHWLSWAGVFCFRLLVFLPWPLQRILGRTCGAAYYYLGWDRRHVVRVNLELCFPELSRKERRALAMAHFQAMGIGVFETGMAWWAPDRRMPRYEIVGREHLEGAAAKGRGVILLTAHFTTLEICGRILNNHFTLGCLYRDPDNAVIARQMRKERIDQMAVAVQMNDLRGLLRALKQGFTIWYAPDQGKRGKFSSILPFFGVPALTNTATGRIAGMTGAAVVPYFASRREDGSYLLQILPALEDFPTADPEADALRINRLMEEYIRKAPEQYFWVHRRFKKRGKEFPNVYRRGGDSRVKSR